MKNNKGITLTSLVIYIALIFVVLAIFMRITTYFSNNMADVADVSFETEFNKLNLYLLDETKKTGNAIQEIIEGTTVSFANGNSYSYNLEEKIIYLNESIKVCENIESCLFEETIAENGKSAIVLTIKIKDITKTVEYVIANNYDEQDVIAEEDYIFNMEGENETEEILLPDLYQQVEYIESTGTQYIDTGVSPTSNTSIEMKASNTSTTNACLYCARGTSGYYDNTYTSFLIGGTALRVDYYNTEYSNIITITSDMVYVFKQSKNLVYVNDSLVKTLTESEFSSAYNMYLMASHQGYSSIGNIGNVKLYYCKIWDGDILVRDFIPCYRKSDNEIGLYDVVNDEFYTNAGTETFEKGSNVN